MNFAFRTILSLLLYAHQGVQVKEAINGLHGIAFKRGLRSEEMVLDVTLIDEIGGTALREQRCCSSLQEAAAHARLWEPQLRLNERKRAGSSRPSFQLQDPIYPLLPAFDYHLSSPASCSFQLNASLGGKCMETVTLR